MHGGVCLLEMQHLVDCQISDGASICQLDGQRDSEQLIELFNACRDFQVLVEGAYSGAARTIEDLLFGLPPGRKQQDKVALGLFGASGDLIGVCDLLCGYPDRGELWIGLLLLRPEQRGTGLGGQFLRSMAAWALAQGFAQIGLGVVSQNEAGYRFWERCGFHEVSRHAGVTMGELSNTVIRMQLELSRMCEPVTGTK